MKLCNIHLKVLEDLFVQLFALDQCEDLRRQHLGLFLFFIVDSLSNQRAVKHFTLLEPLTVVIYVLQKSGLLSYQSGTGKVPVIE